MNIFNQMQLIESAQNPLIKQIKSFQTSGIKSAKLRDETGLALIEGIHLVQTWMDSPSRSDLEAVVFSESSIENIEIKELINKITALNTASQAHKIKLVQIDDSLTKEVTQLTQAPLLIALVRIRRSREPDIYSQNLIILDEVQDAGNVGTILRTAAAAGFKQVLCLKGTAQVWSPKVLRSAMGAHTALSISEGVDFGALLSKLKINLFSARLTESKNLYSMSAELKKNHAWVFGNEGAGVSQAVQDNSIGVFIPQESGVESLNVSAAAAICMFEARRIQQFS